MSDTNAIASTERLKVGLLAGDPSLHLVTVFGQTDVVSLLWDAATALAEQLACRGFRVRLAPNELAKVGQHYIFGIHTLVAAVGLGAIPPRSVIANSEPFANPMQVQGAVNWAQYLPMLSGMHVWDYSQRNISAFEHAQIPALSYSWVPIGFARRNVLPLTRVEQDIDVLFFGRVNTRRAQVLAECRRLGLRVLEVTSGCYGGVRANYFARSKIILNMGWVADSVFEQYRVSYALTNGKAVVTELHADEVLPDGYREVLAVSDYEHIASTCLRLVNDTAARAELEANGARMLQSEKFSECVDTALARVRLEI